MRDKLENDIKNRSSITKFGGDSIRQSPHGSARGDRKSNGGSAFNSTRKSVNDASRNETIDSIPATDMAAIKKMRQSMAVNLGQQALDNKSVRGSIARASVSFKIADGTEAGDLVIENERLKSTLMILN